MPDETILAGTTQNTSTDTTGASATDTTAVDTTTTTTETQVVDTTTETKPDATTDTETSTQDAKPVVPEVYTFTAPEGTQLDEKAVELVTPVLKELGVTQEGAQKLADTFVAIQQHQQAAQTIQWLDQARADKEYGGKDFDASAKLAQSVIAAHGSPELKALLDTTGLGNHPELLRTFVKIGKAMQQDTHVQADADLTPGDIARRLFPTMK